MGLITIFIIIIGLLLFKHLKQNTGNPPEALKDIFTFVISNKISILLVILFIFFVIIISSILDTNTDTDTDNAKNTFTFEAMNNMSKSFCQSHSSSKKLEKSCNQLSETNCKSVGCCVFLNNEKCVSGDKNGPTYLGTPDNLIEVDNYYYKNKCYGNC
jgi:K+-sensing histidine kinase KdpD|tara:strand:+ start:3301 stop:3774 length:474 start_codon:yes stop_codon:yes gene_type:complete